MRSILILPFVTSAAVCAVPSTVLAQSLPVSVHVSADARLKALYEAYADWDQKESGFFVDAKGENQDAAYLPKVDPATQLARAYVQQQMLAQLNAIAAANLSSTARVNAGVLRAILESAIADAKFRDWEMPANSDSNFWTYMNARDPLDHHAEYRRRVGRAGRRVVPGPHHWGVTMRRIIALG